MTLLAVNHLTIQSGGQTLVTDVSFDVAAGELFGLIGPNGAGKSSVVTAIMQLRPYRGAVRLHGRDVATLLARERAQQLAYLSQDSELHWPLTAYDLVALGRYPHQRHWGAQQTTAADHAAITAALQAVDGWTLRQRAVTTLSGGERARIRLARVLAVAAPLMVVDEPVAALDPQQQLRIMTLLRAQCRHGRSVIVVLHDLTLASRFCDRLLLLHHGQLMALGPPRRVLTPALLRTVYGIRAVTGEYEQQHYIVPWADATAMTNEQN